MLRLLLLSIWFSSHPVHVTLTSVDYDTATKDFTVFIRTYLDDLLLDCSQNGNNIGNELKTGDAGTILEMEKYLNERLIITVNDKVHAGKLKNISVSDNDVHMDLLVEGSSRPRILTIRNLIMTKLYIDQSNLMIVRVADFEEGVKLTSEMTEKTFKIN